MLMHATFTTTNCILGALQIYEFFISRWCQTRQRDRIIIASPLNAIFPPMLAHAPIYRLFLYQSRDLVIPFLSLPSLTTKPHNHVSLFSPSSGPLSPTPLNPAPPAVFQQVVSFSTAISPYPLTPLTSASPPLPRHSPQSSAP